MPRRGGSHSRRARSRRSTRSLSEREELARGRAFEALNMMRNRGWSLTHAATEAQTRAETVRRYVGQALRRLETGRYRAKSGDHMVALMRFQTRDGLIDLPIRGSRKRSAVAIHANAMKTFANTGRTDALRQFRGKSIRVAGKTYPFLTDLGLLRRVLDAQEVAYEEIYALTQN